MCFYTRCSKGNGLVKLLALCCSPLLQRISSLHMKEHMYLSPIVSSQRCCWALTSLPWIGFSLATIDSCNAVLNAKYEACQFSNVLLGWVFVITGSDKGRQWKVHQALRLLCCAVSLDFTNLQQMAGRWVVGCGCWVGEVLLQHACLFLLPDSICPFVSELPFLCSFSIPRLAFYTHLISDLASFAALSFLSLISPCVTIL